MKNSILTFSGLSAIFLKHELQNGLISRVTELIDKVSKSGRYEWGKEGNSSANLKSSRDKIGHFLADVFNKMVEATAFISCK